eukprot:s674_g25.t1
MDIEDGCPEPKGPKGSGPATSCFGRAAHAFRALRGRLVGPCLFRLLRLLLAALTPYVLIVGSARLVTCEWFLYMEYSRQGFPADRYGFDAKDRMDFGVYCIRYMKNNEDIQYLESLTLPAELCVQKPGEETSSITGACQMFSLKELKHMKDVKFLASCIFRSFWVLLFLQLKILAFLHFTEGMPDLLRRSLVMGSLFTYATIFAILAFALLAFKTAFKKFHGIFFRDGTWTFPMSSTLIRLYPQRFWIDATITVGLFTLLGATMILFFARRKQKKDERVSM